MVDKVADLQRAKTDFFNDAFSSGQVGSKLWLCRELQNHFSARPEGETVWIYGGWQGVLGFLLLTLDDCREKPLIARIRSFDVDPSCETAANILCENWVWRDWRFRAFTKDCNELDPSRDGEFGPRPTVIINTSTEHFDRREWFNRIPNETLVALQAADFDHDGSVARIRSEDDLQREYPLSRLVSSGRLPFKYETWSFHRLMALGFR